MERAYLALYRTHLKETHNHLLGKDPSARMLPSYTPPLAYWSAQEKDAFFHALTVHSRLRPDLIAQSIGPTKNTLDVCVYLDALHHASIRDLRDDTRAKHPISSEVSDKWLAFEGRNAELLIEAEDEWAETTVYRRRGAEIRKEKWSLRQLAKGNMRKAETDDEMEADAPLDTDVDVDLASSADDRRRQLREWASERQPWWKKEDALRSLSAVHLRVFDWMIRDDPVSNSLDQEEPAPKAGPSTQREISDSSHPQMPPAPSSSPLPATPSRPSVPRPVPNASDSKSEEHEPTLDDLSPASKRRQQKRLWARRKRAQLIGKSEAEVSLEIGRLKPGRKTNKKELAAKARAEREAAEATLNASLQQDEAGPSVPKAEGDVTIEDFHPRVGGATLPYATLAMFKQTGFDITVLRQHGLDLFNHATIGKVME